MASINSFFIPFGWLIITLLINLELVETGRFGNIAKQATSMVLPAW